MAVWQPKDWKEARSITLRPSLSVNFSHIRSMSPQSGEPTVPTASASVISPWFFGSARASRTFASKSLTPPRCAGPPPIQARVSPGRRVAHRVGRKLHRQDAKSAKFRKWRRNVIGERRRIIGSKVKLGALGVSALQPSSKSLKSSRSPGLAASRADRVFLIEGRSGKNRPMLQPSSSSAHWNVRAVPKSPTV